MWFISTPTEALKQTDPVRISGLSGRVSLMWELIQSETLPMGMKTADFPAARMSRNQSKPLISHRGLTN